jgi:redox-regulated HSP33 family molecular chaperone
VRLAVAEEFRAGEGGPRRHWRAGGSLLQILPNSPARSPRRSRSWRRARGDRATRAARR